jgi:tetratricopeptide (TPR) repeat protein
MTLEEEPTEPHHPDPQFQQTILRDVTARDIQIGQIVQKIVYWGIPPHSPLRPFALVISIALYLTLLIIGFLSLWRDGAGFVPLLLLTVGSGLLSLTCLYYAWFWKPEVQDNSPPIPEGSAAEEQVKRQQTKQRSRQQIRRLAIVGFFAVPLLTCAGFLGWRSLPPPKVLLLIANFDGVDPQKYQVTENILRNLRKATEPYADVKVQALDKSITEQQGSEVARAEGEQKKAAIVIWGDYGVTSTNVQISVHFEILNPPTYFPELGKTARGEAQIAEIAELNSFKFQTRLSNEMSYLTIFTLGMVQYAAKVWDGAITRFGDALAQIETKIIVSLLNRGIIHFYRGNCFYNKNNYESAIRDYTQALKFRPRDAGAYNNRGIAYDDQGNFIQAIADFNQAIELKPDDDFAYTNRGVTYASQGDYTQAIADLNQSLRLKPDQAEIYMVRGIVYEDQGNYTWAVADYTRALELKPNRADYYSKRGDTYASQGSYTEAIVDFNQALKLNPDDAWVYVARGSTYARQSHYNQAITDLTQGLKLKPNQSEAYMIRGIAYAEQDNPIQAIADFNQALKLNPDDAEAYMIRGLTYNHQGNFIQAILDYTQALKLKPDNPEAYNDRGIVYKHQGKYSEAIADFNQALKLKPDDASAYYNKACAYSLKREVKAAIENLQRAIDLDTKYQEMAKTDSDFDNIRKDKQFQALVEK